jgi:phosphopantothenoylcysteine decarboxylase/phosphopantothenate--cysteine ligase
VVHPSRAIRGSRSLLLDGRRIVLGISGSIAAIEVPRIVRELLRHGAQVRAVMSGEAARLVSPEAITFATGAPPIQQLTGDVEHVTLLGPGEGQFDLLLIAPATANTLSKIAHGIDDTPVTSFASIALGGGVPVLIAPAMHAHMGQNPAIRENLERLQRWGVGVIAPVNAEGEDKLATPEEIAAAVLHRLAGPPWAGRSVIVVGGAARESIDSVRSVTNESSGATAVALATQAHFRGAAVELWAATMEVPIPPFLAVHRWRGVAELRDLARRRSDMLHRADAVLVPAALSDFTLPATEGKISSRDHETLTLSLTRAPKVLPELRRRAPRPARLVGFKLLDSDDPVELEREGRRLREEADLDWVVANDRRAMGAVHARWLVITGRADRRWLSGSKMDVSGKLLDDLGRELRDLGGASGPEALPRESAPASGPPPHSAGRRSSRRARGRARAARST